jgi:hypothetical protein
LIGHDLIGHDLISHGLIGHDLIGHDLIGHVIGLTTLLDEGCDRVFSCSPYWCFLTMPVPSRTVKRMDAPTGQSPATLPLRPGRSVAHPSILPVSSRLAPSASPPATQATMVQSVMFTLTVGAELAVVTGGAIGAYAIYRVPDVLPDPEAHRDRLARTPETWLAGLPELVAPESMVSQDWQRARAQWQREWRGWLAAGAGHGREAWQAFLPAPAIAQGPPSSQPPAPPEQPTPTTYRSHADPARMLTPQRRPVDPAIAADLQALLSEPVAQWRSQLPAALGAIAPVPHTDALGQPHLSPIALDASNPDDATAIAAPQTDSSPSNVSQTDFSQVVLPQTDSSQAGLPQTDSSQVGLPQTDLSQTDLSQTDLSQTDLSQTDLSQSETDWDWAAPGSFTQPVIAPPEVLGAEDWWAKPERAIAALPSQDVAQWQVLGQTAAVWGEQVEYQAHRIVQRAYQLAMRQDFAGALQWLDQVPAGTRAYAKAQSKIGEYVRKREQRVALGRQRATTLAAQQNWAGAIAALATIQDQASERQGDRAQIAAQIAAQLTAYRQRLDAQAFAQLQAAYDQAAQLRFSAARRHLAQIPPQSQFHATAQRKLAEYRHLNEVRAAHLLRQAQLRAQRQDWSGAIAQLDQIPADSRPSAIARSLRQTYARIQQQPTP